MGKFDSYNLLELKARHEYLKECAKAYLSKYRQEMLNVAQVEEEIERRIQEGKLEGRYK
ncbi:hypothetical protein M316_0016 [Nitrincola phage 1M3-16]|uniref:hypothetical protein n=1 Tax=Nitrincola phage 1M3-16 TaxID=1472912 RepID=UPI000444B25D|nr:hypothetical protein GJ22_gp136 [Nitrincola phage 1M3-16]AHX01081.1 hypothetical protein M316_0016 [Nitrincola phage 1M3-16]